MGSQIPSSPAIPAMVAVTAPGPAREGRPHARSCAGVDTAGTGYLRQSGRESIGGRR